MSIFKCTAVSTPEKAKLSRYTLKYYTI